MNVPNRVPWINLAIGILTIISPYALGATSGAIFTSCWIAGVVIAIVALIDLGVSASSKHMSYWPVINLLAGIWLLIATAFAQATPGMACSDILLGIAAIVTAVVSLSYERLHASEPITH
jgi:SPW repeat